MRESCPDCESPSLRRPRFVWWGGLLGAWLLNHTVCGDCGFGFNARSGKSNRAAIGVYLGVVATIAVLMVATR